MEAPERGAKEAGEEAERAGGHAPLRSRFLHHFVFVAFGFSGAAALVYEVVWTRKLSTVLGSSTYALSTMLAAFMTGLALGGLLGALLIPRLRRHLRAFALCEIAIGLSALATIPLIDAAAPLFIRVYFLFQSSFVSFMVAQFVVIFLVILVPTTLMGMTFPLVIRHFAEGRSETASRAGFLYAFNTFGAVVGSLGAGFLLIPTVGASDATMLAALLNAGGGLVILLLLQGERRRLALIPIVLLAVAVLRLIHSPTVPFVSTYSAHRFEDYATVAAIREEIERYRTGSVIVFHHEGVESDVHLMYEPNSGAMVLSNNGKLERGADTPGFALLGLLPYFSAAFEARDGEGEEDRKEDGAADGEAGGEAGGEGDGQGEGPLALNIGLGSGVTLKSLAALPFRRIHSVELSEGILEANRRFLAPDLFANDRIEHVRADGRNHLLVSRDARYDVIVVSPSWAVEMASAGLLTDEFFGLASQRLAAGGTIALWLDLFYSPREDIEIVFRTFRRHFPHAMAWLTGERDMILVGSLRPFEASADAIASRIVAHAPAYDGGFQLAYSGADLARLPDGLVNTDDRPILEFRNARNLLMNAVP